MRHLAMALLLFAAGCGDQRASPDGLPSPSRSESEIATGSADFNMSMRDVNAHPELIGSAGVPSGFPFISIHRDGYHVIRGKDREVFNGIKHRLNGRWKLVPAESPPGFLRLVKEVNPVTEVDHQETEVRK